MAWGHVAVNIGIGRFRIKHSTSCKSTIRANGFSFVTNELSVIDYQGRAERGLRGPGYKGLWMEGQSQGELFLHALITIELRLQKKTEAGDWPDCLNGDGN